MAAIPNISKTGFYSDLYTNTTCNLLSDYKITWKDGQSYIPIPNQLGDIERSKYYILCTGLILGQCWCWQRIFEIRSIRLRKVQKCINYGTINIERLGNFKVLNFYLSLSIINRGGNVGNLLQMDFDRARIFEIWNSGSHIRIALA